jgi:predicted phage terminase large subunit-like protein
VLERLKRDVGSANFSAQYQQQPINHAGSIVRPHWFTRVDIDQPTSGAGYVQSWDTGIKAGVNHDASACATFVVKEGVHILVDMLVVRQEYPELRRTIIQHAARFSPDAILMEDKGSGQSLLQELRKEAQLPLIACMPSSDKVTRLMRATPLMEAGKMALPKHASWLAAFEQELFQFPDGAHDDQVDAISQYFNWIALRNHPDAMRIRRL